MSFTLEHMIMQHKNSRGIDAMAAAHDSDLRVMASALLAEKQKVAELEEANKRLALSLAVMEAHATGLLAQFRALAAANPSDPLLQDTGALNSRGGAVRVCNRDFYNPAFDKQLAKTAPKEDPKKHRI